MKLSIIMPSHGIGTRINSNILNVATMGSEDVEVIVRDNSGDPAKREFLSRIQEPNCRIISVDDCAGRENFMSLMEQASGEFIYFAADDDYTNGQAIGSLLSEIDRIGDDRTIVGVGGIFIMDDKTSSGFVHFNRLDKPKASERFKSFLGSGLPSILQYSPIRRDVLKQVWDYSSRLPIYLSFHDWLMNCLFLVHGRVTYVERYMYQYVNSNWDSHEHTLRNDANSYLGNGLDSSCARLHWLIGAFEGARTFMDKYPYVDLPESERQAMAACWFLHWYPTFVGNGLTRGVADSQYDAQAMRLLAKWGSARELRLDEILPDLVDHFSLSSRDTADRYYAFWR
jgi:hypothetical protein